MLIDKQQFVQFCKTNFRNNEGYAEFRLVYNNKDRDIRTKFFTYPFKRDVLSWLESWHCRMGLAYHIFMGVNLRHSEEGLERSIKRLHTFAVDVDLKDFDSKKQAYKRIDNFIEPTMLVSSGYGYHVYFCLEQPFRLSSDSKYNRAKEISKGLHQRLNGDSTFDLSRVLRVPGTYNVKHPTENKKTTSNKKHWKQCRIIQQNNVRYDITKLNNVTPDVENNQTKYTLDDNDLDSSIELTTIRDRVGLGVIQRARNCPAWSQNDRSSNDFFIACELYNAGFSDEEVYACFEKFAELGWDAGQKFKEVGEVYLTKHTLPNAKKRIERDTI